MIYRKEMEEDSQKTVEFRCQDVVGFIAYVGTILSRREITEKDIVYITGTELTDAIKDILSPMGLPATVKFDITDKYSLSIIRENREFSELFIQVDEMGRKE